MIRTAHKTAEFTSHLVIMTFGMESLSNCQPTLKFHLLGSPASDARSASALRRAIAGSQIRVLPKTTIV